MGATASTGGSRRRGQLAKRRDNSRRAAGYWRKATAFRQVVVPNADKTRGREKDDVNVGRAPLMNPTISSAQVAASRSTRQRQILAGVKCCPAIYVGRHNTRAFEDHVRSHVEVESIQSENVALPEEIKLSTGLC